ncbi:MAG: hypothetical protein HYX75_22120 [Acidobacteria bacterium]|nr:hypothetical protein [Acidobacteriota bacterium]
MKANSKPSTDRNLLFSGTLTILICVHLGLAVYWMLLDHLPPFWDEAWYLYHGAVQYEAIRRLDVNAWLKAWVELDPNRPSFASTLAVPFYALLGVGDDAGLCVNLIALALLLLSTYGLASRLHGRPAGLLAASCAGGYPLIVGLTHIFMVELIKTAIIALTLLALLKSDGFRVRSWSFVAAIAMACGSVIKVIYPIFVAGPWILTAIQAFARRPAAPRRIQGSRIINVAMTVALPLLVAAPWYVTNFRWMMKRSLSASVGQEASLYGPGSPLRPENLYSFFLEFVGWDLSFAGSLFLAIGLIGLLPRVGRQGHVDDDPRPTPAYGVLFLLSSVLAGYAFLTSLRNQDHNHVSGLIPAVAVLTAWGLARLSRKLWPLPLTIVIGYMTVQLVAGTDPALLRYAGLRVTDPVNRDRLLLFYPAQAGTLHVRYAYPERRRWPITDLVDYAAHSLPPLVIARGRGRIGVVPNYPCVEESAVQFEAYRQRAAMMVEFAVPGKLCEYDALITKTGDPGFPNRTQAYSEITKLLERPDSCFRLLPRAVPLPDGDEVLVYVRRDENDNQSTLR